MSFLTQNRAFVSKLETTPGTLATDLSATANYNRLKSLDFSMTVDVDDEASSFISGDMGGLAVSLTGISRGEASIEEQIQAGQFVDGVSAEHKLTYADYFKACGLAMQAVGCETSAHTEGTYVFWPSATAATTSMSYGVVNIDSTSSASIFNEVVGAMSTLQIMADGVGFPWKMSMAPKGGLSRVYSIPTSAVPAFDDSKAMNTPIEKFIETTLKITDLTTSAEQTWCVSTFTLDMGTSLQEDFCQSSSSGLLATYVEKFNPKITVDPILQSLEEFDYYKGLKNETIYKLEVIGKNLRIMAPRVQMLTSNVADRAGKLANTITWKCLRNEDHAVPTELTGITGVNLAEAVVFISIDETVPTN